MTRKFKSPYFCDFTSCTPRRFFEFVTKTQTALLLTDFSCWTASTFHSSNSVTLKRITNMLQHMLNCWLPSSFTKIKMIKDKNGNVFWVGSKFNLLHLLFTLSFIFWYKRLTICIFGHEEVSQQRYLFSMHLVKPEISEQEISEQIADLIAARVWIAASKLNTNIK